MDDGKIACHFSTQRYDITAFFDSNTVPRVAYKKDSGFDNAGVGVFLHANALGTTWEGPYKDASDNSYRWQGTKDGAM